MNRKRSAQILIGLSIGYGVTVGLLGVFAPAAVAPVAIVGAMVLGGLWAIRGVLLDDRRP
jgi:hypothetical protein